MPRRLAGVTNSGSFIPAGRGRRRAPRIGLIGMVALAEVARALPDTTVGDLLDALTTD